jgi:GNAT superfamily N-acetyltransferase
MTWGEREVEVQAARFEYAASVAETKRVDDVLAVATGVSSNTENGVVSRDGSISDDVVREVVAWLADRRLPASWIHAGGPAGDGLRDELVRLGCREERSGVAMGRDLAELELDLRLPEGVGIDGIRDEAGVDAWLDAAAGCGWLDGDADRLARRRLFVALGLEPDRPLRHWVARRGDRPIGFATAFYAGNVVLFEHLGVIAEQRRRGIGRALVAVRLEEARRRGCRRAVLAPSPDGARLFGGLGFATAPTPARRWFYLPSGD